MSVPCHELNKEDSRGLSFMIAINSEKESNAGLAAQ
jgi:hypothetical protein